MKGGILNYLIRITIGLMIWGSIPNRGKEIFLFSRKPTLATGCGAGHPPSPNAEVKNK
jgi:hypothetical protein